MSEILSRPMVEALLRDRRRLPSSADLLWDCDAALRAENKRLREALREIDAKIGHFADMEVAEFPHALIPLVARIIKAVLAEVGK